MLCTPILLFLYSSKFFSYVYKRITLCFTPKAYSSLKRAIVIQKEKCMLFIPANHDYQRECQRALFIKKMNYQGFLQFCCRFFFYKRLKECMMQWAQKQKIHSGNYSNANSAMQCSCGSLGVYTLSIILTVKHSDNLIGLLKSPVWERLDFSEMLLYKDIFEWHRKMYQDLLCKGKTWKIQNRNKTSKIWKQNTHVKHRKFIGWKLFVISVQLFNYELRLLH